MRVEPYLFFEGRCDEAIDFYKTAVGAEVTMLMRYGDNPEPPQPGQPALPKDKIMHASFTVGSTTVMASDGYCSGKTAFSGFSLTIPVKTEAETERIFNALAAGGHVQQPLIKTFFTPKFGMVQDKFGVGWMVLVSE